MVSYCVALLHIYYVVSTVRIYFVVEGQSKMFLMALINIIIYSFYLSCRNS